jgi:hypothetical protein
MVPHILWVPLTSCRITVGGVYICICFMRGKLINSSIPTCFFSQGLSTWLTHACNYHIYILINSHMANQVIKRNMINPFLASHIFFIDYLS